MDKTVVLDILARMREGLKSRGLAVDKLVLFGSYATGTWREGSDIDVVIVSDGFAGLSYWDRTELLASVIYDIFEPIEAVALTNEEWSNRTSRFVDFASSGEVLAG